MKVAIPALAALLLAVVMSNLGGLTGGGGIAYAQSPPPKPSGVAAANGGNPGEAAVSWNPVAGAAYYRIGWVAMPDYHAVTAQGRDWLEAFAFVDVANRGQRSHTVARLTPGTQYAFIVATNSARYGPPQWSEWAFLTLAGGGESCPTRQPAPPPENATITSSSTSASALVELTLTIPSLPEDAVSGTSVELYLEDDFQVPDSIDSNAAYFTATNPFSSNTNNGRPVAAAGAIEINEGNHFGGGDDWSIRVFVPDMNASADVFQGPMSGQTLTVVFTKAAGIKNPSEQGTHSVGYSILGPNDRPNNGPQVQLGAVPTYAKITLSDYDNTRGYQLTVTGTGFNNGTSAAVHVLHDADATPDDKTTWPSCAEVITQGARAGIATVGSDDKVAITFEVTVPTFRAGKNNYICMVDGEGRGSQNVEQLHMEAYIRVVPSSVNAGDTINVFAHDFPNPGAALTELRIAGQVVWPQSAAGNNYVPLSGIDSIGRDGSATLSFGLPGSISGVALVGTVRIDATWGDVSAASKITITGGPRLTLSKSEVAANESVIIRGDGFGDGAGCLTEITMSGAKLKLVSDDAAVVINVEENGRTRNICNLDGKSVEVSSDGQFAATVAIWVEGPGVNPALTPGTHTIEVWDNEGFAGNATIIIKEPTMAVSPDVAGPLDYVTISGENWPVANPAGGRIQPVEINIDEGGVNHDEDAYPDANGQWSATYQVPRDVVIPSTVPVKASYGHSEIVRVASFSVPAARLTVDPARVAPGDTVTLSATGLVPFESDIAVKIGNLLVDVPTGARTNSDGALDLDVIVPSLEPALYIVQMLVGETLVAGELTVIRK